jgi:hypothetical protein
MKEKILLILILAGLAIPACKKDTTPPVNISGTWITKSSDFQAKVGAKTMTQYFTDVMGLSASDAQLYTNVFNLTLQQSFTGTITLKSDKTYLSNLGGQNETGTWSLSSDGTKLTINPNNGIPMELDVIKLTATELQLHWAETGQYDLNSDGTQETIAIDANVTFNRQ